MRRTAIALSAAAALLLSACATNSESGGEQNGENPEVTLRFGHVLSETHPWHTCGAVEFESTLEAADVGISVEIFPAATTHNNTIEQLDAIESGNLDMTYASPAQLGTRLEKLSVFDAAFLFENWEHVQRALDTESAQALWDELAEASGLRVLDIGYYGTRHVTANVPVSTPEDLEGLKMRVIDAPLWIDNGLALGAVPTPLAFGELYLALQQGVVDAQENPLPVIKAQGFDEVQDYVSLTGHNVAFLGIVFSEKVLESLTEEQFAAVEEATAVLADGVTKCTIEQEEELLDEWRAPDSNIQIHDDVDFEAFSENALDVLFPKYEDVWGDLYREFKDS